MIEAKIVDSFPFEIENTSWMQLLLCNFFMQSFGKEIM